MPSYTEASNLTRTDAKLKRIGRAEDVIETTQNRCLTLPEIAEMSGIPEHRLEKMLPELTRYGILKSPRKTGMRGKWVYEVAKAHKIELLKEDLMSEPQASD